MKPEAPERAASIPKEAIWKGGVDGGYWFLFKSYKKESVDVVIYYEDGDIAEKGTFKKVGNCDIASDKIIESISFFDGGVIHTNQTDVSTGLNCSFKK